jgi:hypothetical protein
MHTSYLDIIDELGTPTWWDEHAVPRYCEFTTDRIADVYATECALVEIACQSCGHKYQVAMSSGRMTSHSLSMRINQRWLHYGDPPNYCCLIGATENSIPLRVLEFWRDDPLLRWTRDREYERVIVPGWAEDVVKELHLLVPSSAVVAREG